jgi:hypothetical protein
MLARMPSETPWCICLQLLPLACTTLTSIQVARIQAAPLALLLLLMRWAMM